MSRLLTKAKLITLVRPSKTPWINILRSFLHKQPRGLPKFMNRISFNKVPLGQLLHPDNFKKIFHREDGGMNHYNIQTFILLIVTAHVGALALYRQLTQTEEEKAKRNEQTFDSFFKESSKGAANFWTQPINFNKRVSLENDTSKEK